MPCKQFVTCKVSLGAISLLYSILLLAKLSLVPLSGILSLVYGATFAESHWKFISICSCFCCDDCLSVVKLVWLSG